jgi:hypothetical protein
MISRWEVGAWRIGSRLTVARCLRGLRMMPVAAIAIGVAGCNWTGSLGGPERIQPVADEIIDIKSYANIYAAATASDQLVARNNLIAARMYIIDMEYTQYEAQLLHEGQIVDFSTKLTSGVLTTAAGLIPAISTSHALSETATLVNGLDSAYNDKILKSQIIQSVMSSMRTARHDRASVIYANMYCSVSAYPIGFALSDLESYYRAGTFQTGLIRLMQTVSKAETDAKATQDTTAPSPPPGAQATLDAASVEAQKKAAAAAKPKSRTGCQAPAGVNVSMDLPLQQDIDARRKSSTPTNVAGQASPKAPM